MATVDEMLNAQLQVMADDVIVIDAVTRQVIVPESQRLFGVESDQDAARKYFRCPKVVGNNIDMSQRQIRINFENANGDKDQYLVRDAKVVGDYVEFSWLLSRKVTSHQGEVKFIVCAIATDTTGKITVEWNTTLAYGVVIEGFEVESPEPSSSEYDVIMQLVEMVNETADDAVAEVKAQIELAKTQAANAQAFANQAKVDMLTLTVDNKVKGTTLELTDASTNKIPTLKVYGKSTQASVPTLATPVPIKNIGDDLTLTNISKSKNLLNVFDSTNAIVYSTLQSDGSLKANLTGTGRYITIRATHLNDLILKSQGKTFTLSIKEGIIRRYIAVAIYGKNAADEVVTQDIMSTLGARTVAVKINEGYSKIDYLEFRFVRFTELHTDTASVVKEIQFEEGTIATSYAPYGMSTQNVSLIEPLRGIGDAKDVLTIFSDGTGQIERRCFYGVITADDVSPGLWTTNGDVVMIGYTKYGGLLGNRAEGSAYCNRLPVVSSATLWASSIDAISFYTTEERKIRIKLASLLPNGTVADFQTWLTNNPLEFVALRSAPVTESLTAEQVSAMLSTYYDKTSIYNTEGAEIEVEYVADTKLYIDNKFKELQALLGL